MRVGIILIMFLALLIVSSCQYKYPYQWVYNIYPAYWKYELNTKLSTYDEVKLDFAHKFIQQFPDIDTSLYNTCDLSINPEGSQSITNLMNSKLKTGYIEKIKKEYKLWSNYKSKIKKNGKEIFRHNIGLTTKASSTANSVTIIEYNWYYDKVLNKWILYNISVNTFISDMNIDN